MRVRFVRGGGEMRVRFVPGGERCASGLYGAVRTSAPRASKHPASIVSASAFCGGPDRSRIASLRPPRGSGRRGTGHAPRTNRTRMPPTRTNWTRVSPPPRTNRTRLARGSGGKANRLWNRRTGYGNARPFQQGGGRGACKAAQVGRRVRERVQRWPGAKCKV